MMKEAGLTRQERQFAALMRFMTVFFLFTATIAASFPQGILTYVTRIGIGLFGWRTRFPIFAEDPFWIILAVASLLTLSSFCWIVSRDVLRNLSFARVIIVSKLFTTIGFIVAFFLGERLFVYLAAAVVDGLIFAIVGLTYRVTVTSRPQSF